MSDKTNLQKIRRHQALLKRCTKCTGMSGPVVMGHAVVSPVMLIGQAPGNKEIEIHKPFAWTAGKTLFKWFYEIGLEERQFRERVYMAAVCRCFPGKNPKGGDRVPSQEEIQNCAKWLQSELRILKPKLILPVGKLAISQLMRVDKLNNVVGKKHKLDIPDFSCDVVPLPHPSGASVWHRVEPGKTHLHKALQIVKRHSAWEQVCGS